jgi:hypothetical protein
MRNGIVKDFVQLHTLLNLGLLDIVPTLDGIPFNAIEAASRMAEIISFLTERTRDPLTLLLTGVMEVDQEITWSPLHEAATNLNANDATTADGVERPRSVLSSRVIAGKSQRSSSQSSGLKCTFILISILRKYRHL